MNFNIRVNVYCDACGHRRKIDKIDISGGNDSFDFGISSTCPNCMALAVKEEEKVTPKKGVVIEVKDRGVKEGLRSLGYSSGVRKKQDLLEVYDWFEDANGYLTELWRYVGEKEWRE